MIWDKEKFLNFILNNKVIGIFAEPIILKSGRQSNWYINWRNIAEDVYLFDQLTDFLISYTSNLGLNPDCFYGVPEGATKLGIITQLKWAKLQDDFLPNNYILPMGRGKPKEHGDPKDKYFLGIPRGKVVLLEDTTTTGESLINCIKTLEEIDVNVIAAIVLTDRNEYRDDKRTVEEVITDLGIKYYAMSYATEILSKLNPDNNIAKKIEEYFKIYGTKPINFK
jgi:orotate phosphoribosyltransferase